MTDFGYHLTNQVNAVSFPLEYDSINPLIYFSNFVGGIWLSVLNTPNVLWAKVGGVLLTSLNSVIVYSILSTYFDRKKVFVVVLISTLFITMYFSLIYIHYFTLPALLINIDLWMLNKTLNTPKNTREHSIYSFLLGFMLIPIILSRITLVLILVIPLFIILCYCLQNSIHKLSQVNIQLIIAGFVASLIIFLLFYWKLGILQFSLLHVYNTLGGSVVNDASQVGKAHTMSSLLSTYRYDVNQMIKGTLLFIAFVYILSLLKDKIDGRLFNMSVISGTFLGIILLIVSEYSIDQIAFGFLRTSAGIILLLSIPHIIHYKINDYRINILLIAGIFVMAVTPIGSDNGLLKAQFGLWLILPLSILLTYRLQNQTDNKRLRSMSSLLGVLLVSLLILSVFFQFTNVYRDDQNRFNLNTEFSDTALLGVYSTNERVEVVDELIVEIRKYSDKGDNVLIVNDIPMLYYLTETKPALGNSWVFMMSIEKIKVKQSRLERQGDLPKLFVYSKINTENRNWPLGNINDSDAGLEKLEYFKERYVSELGYSLLWQNEFFAIYGKK